MSRCRRRDFSQQAWAVLLVWEEVQKSTVDQSLCDDCYNELRETLIDRTDEIESALNTDITEKVVAVQKKSGAKKARKVSKLAS
jgi:hypothetical protein